MIVLEFHPYANADQLQLIEPRLRGWSNTLWQDQSSLILRQCGILERRFRSLKLRSILTVELEHRTTSVEQQLVDSLRPLVNSVPEEICKMSRKVYGRF